MIDSSARAALRAATAANHARVDEVYSSAALDDRTAYGRFLSAQAAAHLAVEDALSRSGVEAFVPDWPERRRGDALRADLAELGLDVPQPMASPIFAEQPAMLGALYVLEGSRLGGTLLKRSVPTGLPTRFLGGADSSAWRALLTQLDEHLDEASKREAAIEAARQVFVLFEDSGRRHLSV